MILAGAGFADTIHVGGAGDPCGIGGHATLQAAIDAAADGDTIIACADAAFTENIMINKSLDLLPHDTGKSVGISAASASSPVISVESDHVNITGFDLSGASGSYGLYTNGSYGRYADMSATGNDIGFFLEGSSHNELLRNTAHDNTDEGFRIASGSDGNILEGNTAYNQIYYGFYVLESTGNTLSNNTAFNSSLWYGFFLYSGATGNTLLNNTAYSNGHHGFHVYMNSGNDLLGNEAYNNSVDGFRIAASSGNNLSWNRAHNNTAEGFLLSSGSSNGLHGNTAYGNLDSGFLLSSSSGNTLSGNDAHNNSLYGFEVHLGSGNTLSSNQAYGQESGFHIFGGSGNRLVSNTAYGNGNGFYVDSGASNELESNTAHHNEIHGFLFSSGSDNLIAGNEAYGNGQHGFYCYLGTNELDSNTAHGNLNGFLISSSPGNTLTDNTAYGNTNDGIHLYLSSSNEVDGNTASNNSRNGFYIYESPRNTLTGNTASGNSRDGFLVYLSPNNNLTGNDAEGNGLHGFEVSSGSATTLSLNGAQGNSAHGFHILLSSETDMAWNTADSNALSGCLIRDSRTTSLQGERYFGNTHELTLNASASPVNLQATGIIIDNPAGDLRNFTNLSFTDRLSVGSSYHISFARMPESPPFPMVSFEGKAVEISMLSGANTIDSITWNYLESEASPRYRETMFRLFGHDGTGWRMLPATLDTSANTLSISSLAPDGIYAILQNRTLPTFTLHNPADGAIMNSSEVNLSWSVFSFDESALCDLVLDGEVIETAEALSGERYDHAATLGEDDHTWQVSCTDTVGTNSSPVYGFTVDFPPAVSLDSPGPESTNSSDYDLHFTAYDNMSETLDCELSLDGAYAGNTSAQSGAQSSFAVTGLAEGSHTLQVICTDGAGNTGASEVKGLASDQTPPEITSMTPPDGYIGNDTSTEFGVNASDELSPMNFTLIVDDEVVDSGDSPVFDIELPEGTHNWSVIVTDGAGNSNQSETRTITIDRTPPSVVITEPEDEPAIFDSTDASISVMFNASDDLAAMLDCSLLLDGALHQNQSLPSGAEGSFLVEGLGEGYHELIVSCTDDAGNAGISEPRHAIVDASAPSLVLISPDDGFLSSDTSVAFLFNASDPISDVVSFLIIDGLTVQNTTSGSFAATLDEGAHTWSILAVDAAGNSNQSQERGITVDATAPHITLNSPPGGLTMYSEIPVNVTFSYTPSDNMAGTLGCTLYLDGDEEQTGSVDSNDTVTVTSTLALGSYSWWAECSDEAGNTRSSPVRSLTITTQPADDDDDDEEEPKPEIGISMERNCPDDTVTFTVSSGSDTAIRLLDHNGLLLNFTRTSGDEATFPIPLEGEYEVRASKSSYLTTTEGFYYLLCYTEPPDDGGSDDDGDDGDDTDTSQNETDPGDDTDENDTIEIPPDDTVDEEPPPVDDPPDVEIIVNDTATEGDEVPIQVLVDGAGASVPVLLISPDNERLLVMTDGSGRGSFDAEKAGRYMLSVQLPDSPTKSTVIEVFEKDFFMGSALPQFRYSLCITFILPFLFVLFALMATFTYFASRDREDKRKGKYKGFKRKREGAFSGMLLKKE